MTGEASPDAPGAEPVEPGLELLAEQPWAVLERELTLLRVRPPETDWADAYPALRGSPACWLLIAAEDGRTLDDPWREGLVRRGMQREPAGPDRRVELTVVTTEACTALFEATTRFALEARWTVRHAALLHDPLARHLGLALAAGRLPEGALERVARPLFVQAYGALEALRYAAPGALVVAGEAAGSVARLACLLEEGAYPPAEWLLAAARETRLGRRLGPWLDELPGAASGEAQLLERAQLPARDILDEVSAALRPHFADREWLRRPGAFALRIPRERG